MGAGLRVDLHAALRDAKNPPHACVEHVDQDGYCTACGEKVLRGPVSYVAVPIAITRRVRIESSK